MQRIGLKKKILYIKKYEIKLRAEEYELWNAESKAVKNLIKKYGVNKLTDIYQCNYKELLELVEEL